MLETSWRVYENTWQEHYLLPSTGKALVTGDGEGWPNGKSSIFFNSVLEIQCLFAIFYIVCYDLGYSILSKVKLL